MIFGRNRNSEPPVAVTDWRGVHKFSSRKLLRHTWRIQQAGHPEIVGRNKWAAIAPKEAAARAAGKFLGASVGSAISLGYDDGQVKERTLLWLAGEERVMQSVGQEFRIEAPWLDRRLAFAVATFADR